MTLSNSVVSHSLIQKSRKNQIDIIREKRAEFLLSHDRLNIAQGQKTEIACQAEN